MSLIRQCALALIQQAQAATLLVADPSLDTAGPNAQSTLFADYKNRPPGPVVGSAGHPAQGSVPAAAVAAIAVAHIGTLAGSETVSVVTRQRRHRLHEGGPGSPQSCGHPQTCRAAHQWRPVQLCGSHLHKAEALGTAGFAVCHDLGEETPPNSAKLLCRLESVTE